MSLPVNLFDLAYSIGILNFFGRVGCGPHPGEDDNDEQDDH